MENNYTEVYLDSIIALASSLVLKSSDTADAINLNLRIQYGDSSVDLNTPSTWKYYLNLIGEYHSTDTVMQVVSVDTLQTIDFTKENLEFHRGTQAAYAYGTTSYLELVNQYPTQEQLIIGILYPAVDIETAINVNNGTILAYPSFLVEANEYSFIGKLQTWIYSYYARWLNPQYSLSDDLYISVFLGILYINLIPAILMFRLQACKTNEAHSYHIRQYLASHGLLDIYLDYMTRSQALFLYRNICYIERNSGKTSTFEWLMQHLLTERGLPLAEFEMHHDLSSMPDRLKPVVMFEKNPLNTTSNYDGIDSYTLKQVFDKEDPLAKDNNGFRDIEQLRSESQMEYSLSNRLKTKLLESSIIDYTGSEHYTLADTLLNHWIWLSHTNHYRAYIQIKSPATDETISLTAKDAFVFYIYMYAQRLGITLQKVPNLIAKRVIRTPRPSVEDLMTVVDPNVISSAEAANMLSMLSVPQPMISVDSFYEYCHTLHQQSLAQYYKVTSENTMSRYSQAYNLMNRAWCDVGLYLADNAHIVPEEGGVWNTVSPTWDGWNTWNGSENYDQLYTAWFTSRNIAIADFNLDELAIMQTALLEAATGVNSSKAITLKQIQAAMVQMMGQLSSYSVQFVASINAGPLVDANTGSSRLNDINEVSSFRREISIPLSGSNSKVKTSRRTLVNMGLIDKMHSVIEMTSNMNLETSVGPEFIQLPLLQSDTLLNSIEVTYDYNDSVPNPRQLTPVLGLDQYLTLSLDNQLSIPDLWH